MCTQTHLHNYCPKVLRSIFGKWNQTRGFYVNDIPEGKDFFKISITGVK